MILESRQLLTPKVDVNEIHTLELPKLPKEAPGEEAALIHWLRLLNAESQEDLDDLAERSTEMRKAVTEIRRLKADELVRQMAENEFKFHTDQAALLADAREDGHEKGLKEGLEEKQREIARNMIAINPSWAKRSA